MIEKQMNKIDLDSFKRRATLRQIEVISHVGQTLSISKTAEYMQMSAAAVSQLCSRFEDHFDFLIFAKRRKGVSLTEQGVEVLAMIAPLAGEISSLSDNWRDA
jgi:DNA-binding transcriptional LysR family regulator